MSVPGSASLHPGAPIVPSSKAPPSIPRTPSSTIPASRAAALGMGASGRASSSVTSRSITHPNTSIIGNANKTSIYDRNLHRHNSPISLASMSFLFCEIVQHMQKQKTATGQLGTIQDLEKRLSTLGYHVGQRMAELSSFRDSGLGSSSSGGSSSSTSSLVGGSSSTSSNSSQGRRETRILGILQYVHTTVWKMLFNKAADGLEKSTDAENEYMIIDNDPLINRFISVPKDMSQLSVAAFCAGIIEAVLDGALFQATVTAHSVAMDEYPTRTVYLIKLDPSVLQREKTRFAK